MSTDERGLPSSVDSERAILGAVLLDNLALTQAAVLLSGDDFSLDSHRRIFNRMMDLMANGVLIDIVSLPEELGRHKELDSVGGYAYLSSLTDGLPRRANIQHYAKTVRDKSSLRKIINACENTIAVAMDQEFTAEHCAAGLQDDLISIQAKVAQDSCKSAKQFMPEVMRELIAQSEHKGLVGLTTGIPSLDTKTTGIRKGEMWVVGALPGRGKTQFGIGAVAANVEQGVPSLVFSLEMTDRQLGRRLLAMHSGVEASKIRDPQWLSASEWQAVRSHVDHSLQWPLYVDDASSLNTRDIQARARLYIRRHKVELIVADYLMLIEEPKEKEARHKARRIANALRQIARDENVAVILLSQLSRPRDGNMNAEPNMISLRESGDIEAAAHVIPLLYMPFDDDNKPTGLDKIIIGKNREGWLGDVPVTYDRKHLRFLDRDITQ